MDLPERIGRYEILGLLGSGGMAEVFLGRLVGPSGFQRPVVIKRILPHLARQQSFVDMFIDEARIVSGIRHANVVHVHELGQDGDELFLVMEYLEGESLASVSRRLSAQRKLLSFFLCAHVIAEACAGLQAAHELTDPQGELLGVVHRDVTPSNVFVTYSGAVKILDFGIATATDRVTRTEAGHLKGKYTYMSPEQCRGEKLDRRSDIFSLGIVLYELSTCRRLFKRSSEMHTLEAICNNDALPPSRLIAHYPESVENVCLRALSRDIDYRYATAADMRRDLVVASRELNGTRIAEETLSSVMHRLFGDRIEEKKNLLRGLADGRKVSIIPVAEVDESIELPTVVEVSSPRVVSIIQARSEIAPAVVAQPLWPKKAWIIGALAAMLTVFVGTALITAGGLSSADADAPPLPVKTIPVAAVLPPAQLVPPQLDPPQLDPRPARDSEPPKMTEIEVTTEPEGALVSVHGAQRGETPLKLTLPRGDVGTEMLIEKKGFKARSEVIVPDRDQRLRLTLEPEPKKKKSSASKKQKPEEEELYHRFD